MASKRYHQYDGKIAGLYDLLETIGKGHFATVKLAKHVFTGEKVAVKVIDKTKLDPVSRDHLFQEVRCMKLVQHPNVVKLYEVIDTQTKLYLVLELGDGGDMYDYIVKHDGGLKVNLCRKYFRQIVDAIAYCHELHVVHRDLKPENVIFFEHLGIVKLTDFGFSNKFVPGTKLETSCGSLAYSAPEILLGDLYDAPAIDVWSLGVILYMLVCGRPPFQEANDSETLTMIMDCKYMVPSHVPASCKDLIEKMLRREPSSRIKLQDILAHPWLHEGDPAEDIAHSASLMSQAGQRQRLTSDSELAIIERMVEGGISTKEEIIRALEEDQYNYVTATFFLLAEKRLKRLQAEDAPSAFTSTNPNSAPIIHHSTPPSLSRQNSAPDHLYSSALPSLHVVDTTDGAGDGPVSTLEASAAVLDHLASSSGCGVRYPPTSCRTGVTPGDRRHSFIAEEEEEEEEEERNSHQLPSFSSDMHVRKTSARSNASASPDLASCRSKPPTPSPKSSESDFECVMGRKGSSGGSVWRPPLRSVSSSPQLAVLNQIHEEREEDDDIVLPRFTQNNHSRFATVPHVIEHDGLSVKLRRSRSCICSDTSDSEDPDRRSQRGLDRRSRERAQKGLDLWSEKGCSLCRLRQEEQRAGDASSDTDGTSVSSTKTHHCPSCSHTKSRLRSKHWRQDGNKKGTANASTGTPGPESSRDSTPVRGAPSPVRGDPSPALLAPSPVRSASSPVNVAVMASAGLDDNNSAPQRDLGSHNHSVMRDSGGQLPKEEFSVKVSCLKHLGALIADNGLGRISNISLSSNASSLSISSGKYTCNSDSRSTPRSMRHSGEVFGGGGKYSKKSKLQTLLSSKEFSDFAETMSRDSVSLCSEDVSQPNSIRIKNLFELSNKNSVISESSESRGKLVSAAKKKDGDCCTIL